MNYTLAVILSFSITIPAVTGWVRSQVIAPAYYPFIILLSCGLTNEIISYLLTRNGHSNAINSNIYALAEGILITLFFFYAGLFNKNRRVFYGLLIYLVLLWITDKLIVSDIFHFSPYYSLSSAFAYVLMSVSMINRLTLVEHQRLVRNSIFIICLCFIFFFTYALLVEIFWLYGLDASRQFRLKVYRIMAYINVGANLVYTFAILWIPRKQEYTML
ncbi:MAG TPA: hypothetical protein VGO58_18780 [Chitinophagaceae bacterium]|jgi:hypothetical protein|nr:hypothetical protein [Chitinophagaceae bacterium]